jgi:hypothetical protein
VKEAFEKDAKTNLGLSMDRCLSIAALVISAIFVTACTPSSDFKPTTQSREISDAGGPPVMRRLTQSQYEQVIKDIFGPTIELGGRFEPDPREGGLLAVGAGKVSVTTSGLQQYDIMARSVATQVTGEDRRETMIGCTPGDAAAPDNVCAQQFLSKVGRLLYRRPLTEDELATRVANSNAAADKLGSFYEGLEMGLAGMLVAPQFIFRQETSEPDPRSAELSRLDAFSRASRLSFFLWNSAPDEQLLSAAAHGELHDSKGIARQVERMVASPRLKTGVRALFADLLEFDKFDELSKDAEIFPKFNFIAAEDAKEQTLRTVVDHLIAHNGDYRNLFTTRKTYLTRLLGALYRVPVVSPKGWEAYEFSEDDQQAGILTHASFVALHSHPGRTSPTLRGKALREILLCQKVPDPPGNVDFNIVQDTDNPDFKTVRQRLDAHASEPMCVGCHKITDPIGLALENFDTIGGFRTAENGTAIDTSGELDGVSFSDAAELGQVVRNHPAATSCLVNRVFSYGVGRSPTRSEKEWLDSYIEKMFAEEGYKLPQLLRRIATSDTFFRISPTETDADAPAMASAANFKSEYEQ